jgi:hypothetical protein
MDVFALRNELVAYYRHYPESFLMIKDERIRAHVASELDDGLLWPDPALTLNPAFASGGAIDDLVSDVLLHSECARIFRARQAAGPAQHRPAAAVAPRSGRPDAGQETAGTMC